VPAQANGEHRFLGPLWRSTQTKGAIDWKLRKNLLKRLLLGLSTWCTVILSLFLPSSSPAQRTFEAGGRVIYEDAHGKPADLGIGFSPVLASDGRVALLRGREFRYGDDFDCADKQQRNWVAIYDPVARTENVLFDRIVPFDDGKRNSCIFQQMQMSHDGSVLYLVSPVYATSGSLAIISLRQGTITYVPGVNEVYVIEIGPHRDELIYVRRVYRKSADGGESPVYPFIHARADGQPIREVSDEFLAAGGHDEVPVLRQYLRSIGGIINVSGKTLPSALVEKSVPGN